MKNALLLEDNADDIATYRRKFLRLDGWRLYPFQSIAEALDAQQKERFDLYLVDSILTVHFDQPKPFQYSDGSDFILAIRKSSVRVLGPIVLITQGIKPQEVGGRWKHNGQEYLVSKNFVAEDPVFCDVILEILQDYTQRDSQQTAR